jgi:hypothetical protein
VARPKKIGERGAIACPIANAGAIGNADMPGIPGRIHRPRLGLEGARPIQQRWEEARQRVLREIPEGNPLRAAANLFMDELNIDAMHDAVTKYTDEKTLAAQPSDPRIEPAVDELRHLRTRYSTAWERLRKAQKLLALVVSRPRHQILQDIPPDFAQAAPQISMSVSDWPEIKTFADARSLVHQMQEMVTHIEGRLAQLDYAMTIESKTLDERNELCIEALFRRFIENEHKLDSVRQQIRDLATQPQKRKATRSRNKLKRKDHDSR